MSMYLKNPGWLGLRLGVPQFTSKTGARDSTELVEVKALAPATRSGFTLIEVVLAIALSVMLFGLMLGFYHHAAEVRDRATSRIQEITARRLIMDRITRELRQATINGFQGTVDTITFNTTVLPQVSVWNEQKLIETNPPPPQEDIQRVTYGLGTYENDEGQLLIAGAMVMTQKLINAQVVEEGGELAPTDVLSPYVGFMRFQYFDGSVWLSEWISPEAPRAVEIALGREPLPEGVEPLEYSYSLARRVVQVHVARRRSITPP